MNLVIVIFAILVLIAVVTLISSGNSSHKKNTNSIGLPYLANRNLFSIAERSFLGVLDGALGSDYRVFGKVRVADVARVQPGLGRSASQGALNRIAYKHFDYVICRAADLTVVCAVELNDNSHSSKRAVVRDELIAGVCRAIGLPLMQVPAKAAYSPQEVVDQFTRTITQTFEQKN